MRRALAGTPAITNPHGNPGWGFFGKHAGYDYGVNGARVYAPETGKIINTYYGTSGGNIIELQGQYTHRFLHLKEIRVSEGQLVKEGDYIGVSGATGDVTGPHLHHDTRKNGTAWNQAWSNYIDWEKLIKEEEVFNGKTAKEWFSVALSYDKRIKNYQKNYMKTADHNKVVKIKDAEITRLKANTALSEDGFWAYIRTKLGL